MTIYSHPQYAASLAEFGSPFALRDCGGWILKRRIPGFEYHDAMGCYPLFACKDWSSLAGDIYELEGKLVSLSLVTDPFGDYSLDALKALFDVCFLFKQHYVTDLSQPLEKAVRRYYRVHARNALMKISIEQCDPPDKYLSEWIQLYSHLINRHHITGIRTFSEASFRVLLSIPGVEMFIASYNQEIIGAIIWLIDGEVGYAHLSAFSPLGYELGAPYALCWTTMQHYAKSLRWLDFGSGPGLSQKGDGLTIFKKGWTNEARPVYLCGKVLDKKRYEEISGVKGLSELNYFPAYRAEEFL
jgi:hypothetical protein